MSDPQSDAIAAEPDNLKEQREQSEQKTLNGGLSDVPNNVQNNKAQESKGQEGKSQASHQLYDTALADQAIRLEVLLKDKRFWKSLSTLSMLASVAAVDRLVGGRYKKRSASEA
jgi:hypothetical protein